MSYQLNEQGIIIDPGKFEGEMWYVPELWDQVLDGCEDAAIENGGSPISLIKVDEEMRKKYNISDDTYAWMLFETGDGFVYCNSLTETVYREYVNDGE